MKDSFIVRKKYWNQIQKLTANQRVELMECVFSYQLEGKYESEDGAVCMLLDIMIDEWEKDEEKYLEMCEKNREIALEREKKKKLKREKKHEQHERVQPCTNVTNSTDNDSDYDSDIGLLDNNLISTNVDIEQSSKGNVEINNLIGSIKEKCDLWGVAYDKTKERQFAKHILTAKEYGAFCEKIGQDRVAFALNVLKVSIHINYWKGICSGPMKIYQNYADVYNKALEWKAKNSKNLIQSF